MVDYGGLEGRSGIGSDYLWEGVYFWSDENVLELDCGDGWTISSIY